MFGVMRIDVVLTDPPYSEVHAVSWEQYQRGEIPRTFLSMADSLDEVIP